MPRSDCPAGITHAILGVASWTAHEALEAYQSAFTALWHGAGARTNNVAAMLEAQEIQPVFRRL